VLIGMPMVFLFCKPLKKEGYAEALFFLKEIKNFVLLTSFLAPSFFLAASVMLLWPDQLSY
jgi:hypothetical protein